VLGVFAAARDVTAQKRAESEVTKQRARELDRLAELERFQKLTVGRELRMIELKKEIEEAGRAEAHEDGRGQAGRNGPGYPLIGITPGHPRLLEDFVEEKQQLKDTQLAS
jgi:hypothetical protein